MSLVPVADVRRIAIGSDHAGFDLKAHLIGVLRSRGLQVQDAGTLEKTPVDYPDVAAAVSKIVARQEADAGIVIDGAGLGSAIAANKVRGHPRRHVPERDPGALQPRAQRRQRPHPGRDAAQSRRGRRHRPALHRDARCASPATSRASRRSRGWRTRESREAEGEYPHGSLPTPAARRDHRRGTRPDRAGRRPADRADATACCTTAVRTACAVCWMRGRRAWACTPAGAPPARWPRSSITRCSRPTPRARRSKSSAARPPSSGSRPSA